MIDSMTYSGIEIECKRFWENYLQPCDKSIKEEEKKILRSATTYRLAVPRSFHKEERKIPFAFSF